MNPYLKTKVLTATPEQLRLMLFDGAIKFSRQAVDALGKQDLEKTYEALTRAQQIVLELSTSLNYEVNPELCDKLNGLYTYIYRRLVDANMERDLSAIEEAIGLLEYERETWKMVMTELQRARERGEDPVADARAAAPEHPPAPPPSDRSAGPIGRIGPGYRPTGTDDKPGFSAEG
jgi:flagellar protein FliS